VFRTYQTRTLPYERGEVGLIASAYPVRNARRPGVSGCPAVGLTPVTVAERARNAAGLKHSARDSATQCGSPVALIAGGYGCLS